ncbi:MAG: EamA family transporter [Desulfovibrio sp.]|nr:EamA family transporter [Desulfovibrio sp.]
MAEEKQPERHFLLGNACILLATIFWGVNVAVTKALIPEWMSANAISAVRLLGGCALFWIASLAFHCKPVDKEDWPRIILGGAVGLFAFIFLFVLSLRYGSAIDISIIMTLPPMFVILMGVLFAHQRPAMLEYAGMVVSFIGAVIVIVSGGGGGHAASDPILGDCLAIASCVCYAFYLFILQKPSRKYKPITLLRWVFLFAAIPGLCLLPGMRDLPLWHADSAIPWLEIGFILFCPTFFAYFLVQPAIRNIGAELVSLYQYLLPVFAAITAVLMGLEQLLWTQVAAMAVIVAGMLLTNIGKKRRKQKALDS